MCDVIIRERIVCLHTHICVQVQELWGVIAGVYVTHLHVTISPLRYDF